MMCRGSLLLLLLLLLLRDYSRHRLALQLILLYHLLLHGIADFDFFFKVIVVLTSCLRLIISSSQHLWCLLLRPKHLPRQLLNATPDKGSLGAYSSGTTDLWLRTSGFLHAWLEIVHVTLTLIDFLDCRDLLLGLRHIEIAR